MLFVYSFRNSVCHRYVFSFHRCGVRFSHVGICAPRAVEQRGNLKAGTKALAKISPELKAGIFFARLNRRCFCVAVASFIRADIPNGFHGRRLHFSRRFASLSARYRELVFGAGRRLWLLPAILSRALVIDVGDGSNHARRIPDRHSLLALWGRFFSLFGPEVSAFKSLVSRCGISSFRIFAGPREIAFLDHRLVQHRIGIFCFGHLCLFLYGRKIGKRLAAPCRIGLPCRSVRQQQCHALNGYRAFGHRFCLFVSI